MNCGVNPTLPTSPQCRDGFLHPGAVPVGIHSLPRVTGLQPTNTRPYGQPGARQFSWLRLINGRARASQGCSCRHRVMPLRALLPRACKLSGKAIGPTGTQPSYPSPEGCRQTRVSSRREQQRPVGHRSAELCADICGLTDKNRGAPVARGLLATSSIHSARGIGCGPSSYHFLRFPSDNAVGPGRCDGGCHAPRRKRDYGISARTGNPTGRRENGDKRYTRRQPSFSRHGANASRRPAGQARPVSPLWTNWPVHVASPLRGRAVLLGEPC